MNKLYVVSETSKDHRYTRFKAEIKKKKNTKIIFVDAYKSLITLGGVSKKGQFIKPTKKDSIWVLSNSTVNHYIIKLFEKKGVRIWPNKDVLDFSDKFITAKFFDEIGVPTPRSVLINIRNYEKAIKYLGKFPFVIKKNVGSVGRYVELVKSEKEIHAFINRVFLKAKKNTSPANRISFLLQDYISDFKGEDIRVLCLKGEIIGAIRRVAQDGGFKANVSLGGRAEQYEVDRDLKRLTKKILKEGKLFYAGIDFLKTKEGYVAIEINTSAQFKGFEAATGINVAKKIVEAFMR